MAAAVLRVALWRVSDKMKQAWQRLRKTCYGTGARHIRPGYQNRPTTQPAWKNTPNDSPEFLQAVRLFLDCSDSLGKSDLYRADAIELMAQYLGSRVDEQIKLAMDAHRAGLRRRRAGTLPRRWRCWATSMRCLPLIRLTGSIAGSISRGMG